LQNVNDLKTNMSNTIKEQYIYYISISFIAGQKIYGKKRVHVISV